MRWYWRLLKADQEVGRVVLHENGRVEARWPDDFPREWSRFIENGQESFLGNIFSSEPRPEFAKLPEYWHHVLTYLAGGDRWDAVDTNYTPPEYPTTDEQGNPIVY